MAKKWQLVRMTYVPLLEQIFPGYDEEFLQGTYNDT